MELYWIMRFGDSVVSLPFQDNDSHVSCANQGNFSGKQHGKLAVTIVKATTQGDERLEYAFSFLSILGRSVVI